MFGHYEEDSGRGSWMMCDHCGQVGPSGLHCSNGKCAGVYSVDPVKKLAAIREHVKSLRGTLDAVVFSRWLDRLRELVR